MNDPTPFVPEGWSRTDPGFGTYLSGDLPSDGTWEYVGENHRVGLSGDQWLKGHVVVVARRRPAPPVTIEVPADDIRHLRQCLQCRGNLPGVAAAVDAALAEQEAGTT